MKGLGRRPELELLHEVVVLDASDLREGEEAEEAEVRGRADMSDG